jgi:hypothetical protein
MVWERRYLAHYMTEDVPISSMSTTLGSRVPASKNYAESAAGLYCDTPRRSISRCYCVVAKMGRHKLCHAVSIQKTGKSDSFRSIGTKALQLFSLLSCPSRNKCQNCDHRPCSLENITSYYKYCKMQTFGPSCHLLSCTTKRKIRSDRLAETSNGNPQVRLLTLLPEPVTLPSLPFRLWRKEIVIKL